MVIENAQMDNQGLSDALGSNASMTASFGFSISDTSGIRVSTPPLIVDQPQGLVAAGDLSVQATGKTSVGAVYNNDGFKYQWYKGTSGGVGSNQKTHAVSTSADNADYYVVISNELGEASSNLATVTIP